MYRKSNGDNNFQKLNCIEFQHQPPIPEMLTISFPVFQIQEFALSTVEFPQPTVFGSGDPDFPYESSEAGAPRHWHLVEGNVDHELVS
ncbi:unnamed protein product [Toxocara canis]|uniref:Ovule protein n=1 Tax=Toxocara canis TaxID=6265 RepID=A0A183V835_TOXCA|nr:unnamed protein product [Toxocara canis]